MSNPDGSNARGRHKMASRSRPHCLENHFFDVAARSIIRQLLRSLQLSHPDQWQLSDALHAMRTLPSLKQTLEATAEGEALFQRYFSEPSPEVVASILSAIEFRLINQPAPGGEEHQ